MSSLQFTNKFFSVSDFNEELRGAIEDFNKKEKNNTLFCTHHHHHQAKTVVSLRFKKKYASKDVRISKICLFCRFTTGTTGINSKLNIKSVNEKYKIFNFKL